ncbi:MAG: hypothetical protein JWQ61_4260 [Collimonas fungivorans]|uniref:hypothetical protein n=1 Tax=Collimonas fungivorans TaxID=158899 RepID=UPI0026F12C30|nr:hypothetical protein [Collimonas fungivorans]MDB5769446.1 hypothetical protein [Collimonas fungivorans]
MEFTIAFSFTTQNDADTLSAQLTITDNNEISLESNQPVQISPVWSATPPLTAVSFGQKSLALTAAPNTSSSPQSIKVTLPIKAVGTSLSGKFESAGVIVNAQYQFLGYSNSGRIAVGNFTIPFPN